jgi:FkbM family methyltransferase
MVHDEIGRWRRRLEHKAAGLRQVVRSRAFRRRVAIRPRDDLIALGSGYGFWVVPETLLGTDSCCYLAGIGRDITFDLALIARFGCVVHAFDPVPEAQEYARGATRHEPRFVLHPLGLWSSDTVLPLHRPAVDGHISHSATDLHGTARAFDAQFRSVDSLMRELGHDAIDLLKVSAEGSEYEVLRDVVGKRLAPRVICVEFAQPAPAGAPEAMLEHLQTHAYHLVDASITPWSWRVTFVHGGYHEE